MRRREVITLLGGGVVAWPLAARAQERVRRIGVLKNTAESDSEAKVELAALVQELKNLRWTDGQNIHIDYRFGAGDANRMVAYAKELVALKPDVMVARSTPALKALATETTTIPIVFIGVSDPVGEGFAVSLARPGRNATGFTNVESPMAAKWVELLQEIVPDLRRVTFMFNPPTAPGGGAYYARLVERAAGAVGVIANSSPIHAPTELENTVTAVAREPGGGLLVLPDAFMNTHRALTIEIATRHRVPAVFTFGHMAAEGGLIAYGVNTVDLYQRSAFYVDQILRGTRPGDLPIQAPTKFELVVNLKTAKAIGLNIPEAFLLRADKVIE